MFRGEVGSQMLHRAAVVEAVVYFITSICSVVGGLQLGLFASGFLASVLTKRQVDYVLDLTSGFLCLGAFGGDPVARNDL